MLISPQWQNVSGLYSRSYQCAYCDHLVASSKGWVGLPSAIYICSNCEYPTFFEIVGEPGIRPVPAPKLGEAIRSLPDDVQQIYDEARDCTSSGSYTAALMLCRKLLMHIAVEKGAAEGLTFKQYVTYLDDEGYVPRDARGWVDRIKDLGNVANHELTKMKQPQAAEALEFTGMLLKLVYDYPSRVPKPEKAPKI